MDRKTDFLVPVSSALVGIGSLLNFSGNYFAYNQSHTPEQADCRAIYNDWSMIGQDLRQAMKTLDASVARIPISDENVKK